MFTGGYTQTTVWKQMFISFFTENIRNTLSTRIYLSLNHYELMKGLSTENVYVNNVNNGTSV